MKKSVEKTEEIEVVDLVKRGKEYLELEGASRWVDKEYFDSKSEYVISDKFWRASQNNLRRLKGVAKDFDELKTDLAKEWKKKIDFNEDLYEKGRVKDEELLKGSEYKTAKQYVHETDLAYSKYFKSDEIIKVFDEFYESISEIEFYKVDAEVIEKLEVPFDVIYLVEKYYQK